MTGRLRTGYGAVGLILLSLLSWWAVAAVNPPAVVPASAPAGEFSGARARVYQEHIGAQVHVAGSAAAGQVRQYIIDTLSGLGVQTRVQDAVGATDALGGMAMARVQNVVAEIPGTASTGKLFLVAHYDSVQVSYGAGTTAQGCPPCWRPLAR